MKIKIDIKEKLEMEISRINNILLKAQEAFLIVEYLYGYEEDKDLYDIKNTNDFLGYSKYIYWQVMVMELSKLFKYNTSKPDKINSNDRFNLRLFINKFKPKGEFHHFKISNIKLKEWIHKLDHNEEIIKNILTQRNKLYAHEEETLIKNIVPLHQIKPLMLIVYDILKEIHHTIFERGIDFTPINSPVINLKVIVNNLAKYKKIKLNEYKSLADDYGLEDELK